MTARSPAYGATGFRRFMDRLLQHGLEAFNLYYGTYRAEVVDNSGPADKQGQGIVLVRVPSIGDKPTTKPRAAYPKFPFAGNDFGHKFLPPNGGYVYVEFENGRLDTALWTGGWWARDEMPEEMRKTTTSGFKTPGGHSFLLSDEPGNRFVRVTWHSTDGEERFAFIELTKDGGIALSNKNGTSVFLDAENKSMLLVSEHGHSFSMTEDGLTLADKDGNVITIDKGSVTVLSKGDVTVRGPSVNIAAGSVFAGDPAIFSAVCGELLLVWLATHVHTSTAPGSPTSPPLVPPLPMMMLSNAVKVSK